MKLNLAIKTGLFVALTFVSANSIQAQKTLSLDNITALEPIIINDTTNFQVSVGVINGASLPDTVTGDIFYWYLTDSMIMSSQPARKLEQDFVSELVPDGFIDTIHIDIQPNEIRTTPVNLIILWPAMIDSSVSDTHSISMYVLPVGFLHVQTGINPPYSNTQNLIFPCPTLQYIYIRHEELSSINKIIIYSMDGQAIATYENDEFKNGMINLENFVIGNYLVELIYYNNEIVKTKILKR